MVMKTSEADISFPVLGFTPDLEIWGFRDLDPLTKCGPRTLKERKQLGMELVDAEGRRWLVQSVNRTGRAGSLLSRIPILGLPQSRIEQELEPMAPLSLDEVRGRARTAMETHSINYLDGDDPDLEFKPLLKKVGKARSVAELHDLLPPDTFEPY
jgi:hypothetical protein